MSALVMLSALGAIQGLLFTGSRIYASVGRDHAAFGALARWHPRFGTPMRALLAQSAVTLAWIAGVGTAAGRGAIDAVLSPGPGSWHRPESTAPGPGLAPFL